VPNFIKRVLFLSGVINCSTSITKYLRYQYGITQVNPSVTLQFRNSIKQQLILTKFYTNNALFIGIQIAKFQLNPPKQTIATAAFVRSPQNTSASSLCG